MTTTTPNFTLTILILLTILFVASVACSQSQDSIGRYNATVAMDKRYREWLRKYKRKYSSRDEWNMRFGIYQSNVQFIEFINSQNLSYTLTDNQFADLTNLEFESIYMGYRPPRRPHVHHGNTTSMNVDPVPASIDWRKKGAVAPIKDQGSCGSCWAFSAVSAIEGLNKIKTGKLVTLSEQQLVDCDADRENQGCNGGFMEQAFEFIIKNGGIASDKDYPYEGRDGKCDQSKASKKAASITGYKMLPPRDAKALLAAAAKQPVAVAIDAGGIEFQLYSGGIFAGYCGSNLNHGVNLVGYGEENGFKYWIVRNSWGSSWGEEGYIKMLRSSLSKDGMCGITLQSSYPTKDSEGV